MMFENDTVSRKPSVLMVYYTFTQQALKVAEAMAGELRQRGCDVTLAKIEFTDERWVERFSRFPFKRPLREVLGMFVLVRAAGGGPRLAVGAAALMAADNLLLVHGRIGTLDIYALAAMVWAAALYVRGRPLPAGVVIGLGICAKVVQRWGGKIARYVGDGLLRLSGVWDASVAWFMAGGAVVVGLANVALRRAVTRPVATAQR